MNLVEKTEKQTYIYKGRIINLRCDDITLPDGNAAKREVVEHPGGVGVLPIDSNGDILLVEQFRYPYKEATLEIPAGKRNSKEEDPLECGKRELREETGVLSDKLTLLGTKSVLCDNGVGVHYYIYLCVTDMDKKVVTLQKLLTENMIGFDILLVSGIWLNMMKKWIN